MTALVQRVPRWERRKESRPAELLAAALDVFVERGFAATRLDDVALRAGVSKGTLYLYYENKAELFKAAVRENIVSLIEEARDVIERSDEPSSALLAQFFSDWWQRFGGTKLSGILKLIIAESGNFPDVAQFFAQEVAIPDRVLLKTIVLRGIRQGEFECDDIDAAVDAWIAPLVMKAIMRHSLDARQPCGLQVTPERMIKVHIALVLKALTPQSALTRPSSHRS